MELTSDGVNIAARLEALAQPNGITISKSVYDLVVPTKLPSMTLVFRKLNRIPSMHMISFLIH